MKKNKLSLSLFKQIACIFRQSEALQYCWLANDYELVLGSVDCVYLVVTTDSCLIKLCCWCVACLDFNSISNGMFAR